MVAVFFILGFVAVGWIAGVILYHAGSVGLGLSLPGRRGDRIARYHFRESMRAIKRFLLYIRERADVKMLPSKPNVDEGGGERITVDGEPRDFEDPAGTMGYLWNTPMSIAVKRTQVLVDPIIAEAGAVKRELQQRGAWWRSLDEYQESFADSVTATDGIPGLLAVDRVPHGVDMDAAIELVGSGAEPDSTSMTYDFVEKSQSAFDTPNQKQLFVLGMLFAIGAGAVIIMDMFVNGGGGTSSAPAPPTTPTPGNNVTNAGLLVWLGVVTR